MSKHSLLATLVGVTLSLSGSAVLAQGFGGGGGGGGFGGGGGGGGGGAGGQRTPGASTQSLGANVNQAQPLPLITSRQVQSMFGARTLSQPFQQRYRGLMGSSQNGRGGGGGGQYATSGQYRSARQSPSSGSFSSFSSSAQGQRPQTSQPIRRSRSGAGNAAPLRAGSVGVGFELPKSVIGRITGDLEQRMGRVLEASAVEIRLQGRTAVLRGSVATDHDRAVAEQLALLEPGISFVRNELSTTSPPESETAGPTKPSSALPPAENLPDPPQLPAAEGKSP